VTLIPPVGVGATAPNAATTAVRAAQATPAADTASSSNGFGNAIDNALDSLQASQTKTDGLARDAATGKLKNIEDYLISATDTQLGMQLTVAVRNKAVESFNEIMRMQV